MLGIALAVTASFLVVEAVVGWLSGSLALLADAGHMLADTGALALALLAQRWARRPRNERSTFGYRRAEVLAAFVNGIALAVTALFILVEAVERVLNPRALHAESLLIVAGLGLLVNLGVAWLLHGARAESVNVRAALAHVVMDAMGSVAAILAGVAALLGLPRADPVLAGLIALLVAASGWRLLVETTAILLEGVPRHLDVAAIERSIRNVEGVASLHDLHVWCISDRFDALTVHVVLGPGAHGVDVARRVAERVRRDFGIHHATVQPEAPPPPALVALHRGPARDGAPPTP